MCVCVCVRGGGGGGAAILGWVVRGGGVLVFRNILHHDVGIPSVFCFTDDISEPARCTRQFSPTSADSLCS